MDKALLMKAAAEARGLAIDAIHACNSGHLGLPLGCAEIGAALFGQALCLNPDEPRWLNRDRFILSGGHGSMFIYSWLHLAGFDLSIEDIKNFRQLHSKTPGHPEYLETPGVECTTGPLGQGLSNAVGFAVSQKMAAAQFNTEEHKIIDNHIVALGGDGCFQEGVSAEASAFAAHFGLDNLIFIYDSNGVTLDAMANATQSEDTAKRYEAYGFDVCTVDGHDVDAFINAFEAAKAYDNGKPKLIIAKTEIGRGIPEVAGTAAGHGEGGAKYAESARKGLGLPEETFYVSDEVKAYFAKHKETQKANYASWLETFNAWKAANPEKASLLESMIAGERPNAKELCKLIPEFDPESSMATRASGGKVLQPLAQAIPYLTSGSADLHGSTKNYINGVGNFTKETPEGRNYLFGIREHAMGAIMNGIAYDGLYIPSGATFLTFADYMRGAIRIAALMKLPLFYIFTHDSIGVGEDGPTHQPVETVSSLRCFPNMDVIRPADAEETAAAFSSAVARKDGPTSLILSRQNLPTLGKIPVSVKREGTLKGAYIAVKENSELEVIIIATGSELQHAIKAAETLGSGVRVVSMPSMEIFDRQDSDYKESVLPSSCTKRVAIEAGISKMWYKYVGSQGKVLGIDKFGISAPGNKVMELYGMTPEAIIEAVKSL